MSGRDGELLAIVQETESLQRENPILADYTIGGGMGVLLAVVVYLMSCMLGHEPVHIWWVLEPLLFIVPISWAACGIERRLHARELARQIGGPSAIVVRSRRRSK